MTKEEFIEKAKEKYSCKYDYSYVDGYKNRDSKVKIICPTHGPFYKNVRMHLNGYGCPECSQAKNYALTTDKFIKKAREIHGDKYDYSKVNYENSLKNVCIICPVHGEFLQIPSNHLQGAECPKCSKRFMNTEYFIERSSKIHGNKYDYSKVYYVDSFTDVTIICQKHGEFKQKPREHLRGCGCPKCGLKRMWDTRGRITKEDFIEKAKLVHGDKYDYSKIEYINERTPVCIICHKKSKNGIEHGEFWQKPIAHLRGNGCRRCRNSHLENQIRLFLIRNEIEFEQEKTFDWLVGNKNSHLYLDFYLPESNVAIECQGVQHFISIKNDFNKFNEVIKNDKIKEMKCLEHGVKIIYFSDKVVSENYSNRDDVLYDKNKLLLEIKKC